MPRRPELTPSRRGAWIINTTKHLLGLESTELGLSALEAILFAGKCGSLLIKLCADKEEQLGRDKVVVHARCSGIGRHELDVYCMALKAQGCIDWNREKTTYSVLAFTRDRVLVTTSRIFDASMPSDVETGLLNLLEFCLERPRLESEVEELASASLASDDIRHLLRLVKVLGLLGVSEIPGTRERLYFNEYQFGDRWEKIGKALAVLSGKKRDELDAFLEDVTTKPGLPTEGIKVSDGVRTLAIGLGLVEVSEVQSSSGRQAQFLTMPHLAPPSVGEETSHLEDDVFHHAKMLLSSLRFGESFSSPSRGRIIDPLVLAQALLEREQVGPCTAIGEDYVILEQEGVIRTVEAKHKPGQYYMQLRRREPAEIVTGLLRSGTASSAVSASSLPRSLVFPTSYSGPERSRPAAARKVMQQDPELVHRFMEAIRT